MTEGKTQTIVIASIIYLTYFVRISKLVHQNFLLWKITNLRFYNYLKKKASGELSINLLFPTPAKLRNECIIRFKQGSTRDDLFMLKSFFERPLSEELLISSVKRFDIDKFRPLCKFLKKNLQTSEKNIELLAWLIDFKSRPYARYVHELQKSEKSLSNLKISRAGAIIDNILGIAAPANMQPVNSEFEEEWEPEPQPKHVVLEYPSGVKIKVDASDLQLIQQLVRF